MSLAAPRSTSAQAGSRILRTSGPKCEFFVFDDVHYDLASNHSHYFVDSARRPGTPASRISDTPRGQRRTLPAAPSDSLHDLRTEMVLTLERIGIPCEFHHHEVASGGQLRDRSPLHDAHPRPIRS